MFDTTHSYESNEEDEIPEDHVIYKILADLEEKVQKELNRQLLAKKKLKEKNVQTSKTQPWLLQ